MKRYVLAGLLVTSVSVWADPPGPRPPRGHACASLAALTIPERHGQRRHARSGRPFYAARPVAPDTSTSPLPAFCRVEATARPTSDSEIKFEVWIPPVEAWNGKFQGVGNGGYQGSISYTAWPTRCAAATRRRAPTPATPATT